VPLWEGSNPNCSQSAVGAADAGNEAAAHAAAIEKTQMRLFIDLRS
jgi:hypothetical protein